MNLLKYLNLFYVDDQFDEIEIDSDESLDQAYRYFQHIRNVPAVPKIMIRLVGTEDDQSPEKVFSPGVNG